MEKKFQVFISSTYRDLVAEREKVRDVVLSMYHFPIGMEMFNAADEEQWEIIVETIDSSDYYVLILGKRYGTIISEGPDAGISYTEKEFRYAKSKGIPILAFIKNDVAVTSNNMDTDNAIREKLRDFENDVKTGREVDWFGSVDELGTKVTLALHKQIDRKKRPGWVRGDQFDVDASLREIVILNERIRDLEAENEKLRETAISRNPELNMSLQFVGTIEKPLGVDDNCEEGEYGIGKGDSPICITVERKPALADGFLKSAYPLKYEEIPSEVGDVVSQEDIEEYNRSLPSKNDIQKYNEQLRLYSEVKENGLRMNFILANDGTSKATDINISLEFPKEMIVMKRAEAEELMEPTAPKTPQNPIDTAMAKKQALTQRGLGARKMNLGPLLDFHENLCTKITKPYRLNSSLPAQSFTPYKSINIEQNTVIIWSKDLLHTCEQTFDDICIIPIKIGSFKIVVTIICEEYAQPKKSELEIKVID